MLSVVVPAFRAARTLPGVLSALRAADPALPVLVVDDGCPEGSGDIAEDWAHAHRAPLTVIRNPRNLGTSAARNVGWRATAGALVAFVDADVEVSCDALRRLVATVERDETLLGANGTLASVLDDSERDVVSTFVNTSLRYQLASHGARVATAFTSLCVFRRSTLEQMGGWDERRCSRYGDDVATRWRLPPASLEQVPEAVGLHRKRVPLLGLLRHRVNVGSHFVQSLRENRRAVALDPRRAVITPRYPQNTILAACSLPALGAAIVETVVGGLPLVLLGLAWMLGNASFLRFVAREDGPLRAAIAVPLTILEGHALFVGVLLGLPRVLRRSNVDP